LLTIVFAGVSSLAIIIIIILISSNSKIRKKNDKLIGMLQALRDSKKNKDDLKIEKKKNEQLKKEKELQDELRKKQEEFLETGENEIVSDDVELEESTPVKKSKNIKKKKES